MLRSKTWVAAATAATSLGLALPGGASAATTSYSGTLLVHLPLKASEPFPCSGPGLCGAGPLKGLGAVQITVDDEEVTQTSGDCFNDVRSETIGVLDGSGTIVLDSNGTIASRAPRRTDRMTTATAIRSTST